MQVFKHFKKKETKYFVRCPKYKMLLSLGHKRTEDHFACLPLQDALWVMSSGL